MMARIAESTVEEAALELFSGLGYTILHGPDIAPGELFAERTSYEEVVLVRRLHEVLFQMDPEGYKNYLAQFEPILEAQQDEAKVIIGPEEVR